MPALFADGIQAPCPSRDGVYGPCRATGIQTRLLVHPPVLLCLVLPWGAVPRGRRAQGRAVPTPGSALAWHTPSPSHPCHQPCHEGTAQGSPCPSQGRSRSPGYEPRNHPPPPARPCPLGPLTSSVVSGMQMRYSLTSMVTPRAADTGRAGSTGVRRRRCRGQGSCWRGERGGRGAASRAAVPAPPARSSRPARGDFTSRCHGSGVRSPVRGAAWVYPAGDTPAPQNPPGVNPVPARQTHASPRSARVPPK